MSLFSLLKSTIPRPVRKFLKFKAVAALHGLWSIGDEDRRCDVRGLSIVVGVSSETESYRAETYASKEPETLDWLDANLRDGDVLYDVGANIGVYSLYAAKRKQSCRVYAFEPAAQNFARLLRNIKLNGLDNVIPCNMPLSDAQAFALFFVSDLEAGSALHNLGADNPGKLTAAPSLRQGALSISADSLVSDYGLPAPNLIKIDVDGLEDKIVAGALKVLRAPSLRGVLVEASRGAGGTAPAVEAALAAAGFKLAATGPVLASENGSIDVNLIYSR